VKGETTHSYSTYKKMHSYVNLRQNQNMTIAFVLRAIFSPGQK